MELVENTKKYVKTPLATAWAGWHANNIGHADLAVVLNAPDFLAYRPDSLDFQQLLRRALHEFDRRMLGNLHRKHKYKVPRLVTIERSKGTGLHANISLKLWKVNGASVFDAKEAADLIKEIWAKHAKIEAKFVGYGAYAELVTDDFVGYTLKHVGTHSWHTGEVDVNNSVTDQLLDFAA
jgi:hypothetical protein